MAAPIILVPGYWLGAWAWDEVVAHLESAGHQATALTLPGLETVETDRSGVTAEDHVTAITDAIEAAGSPVVLVMHSGAGFPGYAATDRLPDLVAAAVYVDTGPGVGAMNQEFEGIDFPLPSWEELEEDPGNSLEGVSDEKREEFRRRSVPQPGGSIRAGVELTNPARHDIPSTIICTTFTADDYRDAVEEGYAFIAGAKDLRNLDYVEMPTGHWSMWSKPEELARMIGSIAEASG
jgi:pimeloyl-ACP methyl ester carboxylesterase